MNKPLFFTGVGIFVLEIIGGLIFPAFMSGYAQEILVGSIIEVINSIAFIMMVFGATTE